MKIKCDFICHIIILKINFIETHPTVTSNILLPTELETAISPRPFLATRTDVIRSGIEVPAAKNVRPIISAGILKVSPTKVAHQTIKYE